jgi:hypothetical protein
VEIGYAKGPAKIRTIRPNDAVIIGVFTAPAKRRIIRMDGKVAVSIPARLAKRLPDDTPMKKNGVTTPPLQLKIPGVTGDLTMKAYQRTGSPFREDSIVSQARAEEFPEKDQAKMRHRGSAEKGVGQFIKRSVKSPDVGN